MGKVLRLNGTRRGNLFCQIVFCTSMVSLSTSTKTTFGYFRPSVRKSALVLDLLEFDRTNIYELLGKFPEMRYFHTDPPYGGPTLQIASILASSINSTLISSHEISRSEIIANNYPLMFPILSFSGTFNRSVMHVYDKFKQGRPDNLALILGDPVAYNYVYCNVKSEADEGISITVIFLGAADIYVWVCLAVSIIFVSFMIRFKVEDSGQLTFEKRPEFMLATVSALLSPGMSGQSKQTKYSSLFCLWMLNCLIFVTFYSGSLTSEITSPVPEARLTRIAQLEKNNFTLLYDSQFRLDMIKSVVEFNRNGNYSPAIVNILDNLLKSAKLSTSQGAFTEMMVSGVEKYASVNDWAATIYIARKLLRSIADSNSGATTKRTRHRKQCYIGKEMACPEYFYVGFAPPESSRLARKFQWIVDSGIGDLWSREFIGIATSSRVQSRSKVVSPTKIKLEVDPFKPLILEGKLKNVFVLWGICLAICFMTFLIEMGCKSKYEFCCFQRAQLQFISKTKVTFLL